MKKTKIKKDLFNRIKEIGSENKVRGITLISLVITIVILIILAGVTINVALGQKGIINQVKQATIDYKKAQYFEDINLEIIDEQTERSIKPKNELFIDSIEHRLGGTPTASVNSTKVYTKKDWVDKVTNSLNKVLLVETIDGYEIFIDFDNANNTATIREDSFGKISDETYKITFNSNDGTERTSESDSVRKGLVIELEEDIFERQNYTFVGWYDNAEGTGDRYREYTLTEDVTLYAKWSQHAVSVEYKANGGEGTMSNINVEIGDQISLTNEYTRTGYTFNGWKDQNNKTYTKDETTTTATEDLTLTAQWEIINYTIEYKLNGGSLAEDVSNPTTYTVETDTFTLNNPGKSGYTFTGWTESNEDTPQTSLTIEKGTNGDKSYTANWMINSLEIYNAGTMRSGDSFSVTLNYKHSNLGNSYTNSFSTANNKLTLSSPRNPEGMCIGITNNSAINLSQYNRLHVSYSFTGTKSAFIFVGTDSDRQQSCSYWTSVGGLANCRSVEFNSNSSSSDWYLDYTSSLTSGYVFLGLSTGVNGDSTKSLVFTKVWLTKE